MPLDAGRVEEAFATAVSCETPADRERFLEAVGGDDPELCARVRALLRSHDSAGDFLSPAMIAAGGSPAELAGEEIGSWVGPYRLVRLIGEGGFGSVYLAEQEQAVRRQVALKVVKPGMDSRQVLARFDAEREALALMDHPNIARVLDAGVTQSGRPFFVMELVEGRPITQFCDDNGLGTRQRLELFLPVCQAVQHAHQKGIIHRDLKPSNILVTVKDGVAAPKVIDFGIAKAVQSHPRSGAAMTEARQMLGTPHYMSPEQAVLGAADVDTRSDVYSLGVLLYELLTGSTPLDVRNDAATDYAKVQQIIREVDPPPPSTRVDTREKRSVEAATRRGTDARHLRQQLRGELDWIALKCLEKDRTRRYESAGALAADVRRHLGGQPVAAGPPGRWYRVRKFVRRHKLPIAAAAVVMLAVVAGLSVAVFGLVQARHGWAAAEANEAAAKASHARLLLKEGNAAAAEPLLRDALSLYHRLRPDDDLDVAAVRSDLASALQSRGDLAGAEALFRQSLAAYSKPGRGRLADAAMVLRKLARCVRQRGDRAGAETFLRQALERYRQVAESGEGLASVLSDLGTLVLRDGNRQAAEPLLVEALRRWQGMPGFELRRDPDVAMVARDVADLLQARGDRAGSNAARRQQVMISVVRWTRDLKSKPDDWTLLTFRGAYNAQLGNFKLALPDYVKRTQIQPGDHVAWYGAGCIHYYLGDVAAYRRDCREMVERFAGSSDYHVRDRTAKLCLLATSSGSAEDEERVKSAAEVARRDVKPDSLVQDPPVYQMTLGMAEYRMGDFKAAAERLSRCAPLLPPGEYRATALFYLALSRHQLDLDGDARRAFDEAERLVDREIPKAGEGILFRASGEWMEDWLICQLARREAAHLFPSPTTQIAKP